MKMYICVRRLDLVNPDYCGKHSPMLDAGGVGAGFPLPHVGTSQHPFGKLESHVTAACAASHLMLQRDGGTAPVTFVFDAWRNVKFFKLPSPANVPDTVFVSNQTFSRLGNLVKSINGPTSRLHRIKNTWRLTSFSNSTGISPSTPVCEK